MKKTKVFKRLIISVLALSMVLGSFCMTFAEEQSDKPADEPKAELVVSEIGYDDILGVREETLLAKKGDKWGMVKFDGTELLPFEYDDVISMDNDTIVAMKDDKWGMVKSDGTVVVPFEYDDYSSCDTTDGVVVLKKIDGEGEINWYTLVSFYAFDKSGKELYRKEKIRYEYGLSDLRYSNGLYLLNDVYTDTTTSVAIDSKGNTILTVKDWELGNNDTVDETTKYEYTLTNLSPFGYAVAYFHNGVVADDYDKDKPSYLVNKDGYEELNIDLKGTRPFWTNGKSILCSKFEWIYDNLNDNQCKNSYYILNISTNELVKIYEYIGDAYDRNSIYYGYCGDILYLINKDENGNDIYSLFDANGKPLTEKKYSDCENTADVKKYYTVSDGDRYFYIDANGKEYGTEFKDVGGFTDGQAIVLNQDGQAYVIDEDFKQISTSVQADAVATSINQNAYIIKKISEDGSQLEYPAYIKSSTDTYTKELTDNSEIISSTDFSFILAENAAKNVVIKNADGVEFSFAKGTMTAVEGKTEYDFGTTIIRDYDKATGLSTEFTRDNFALQIIYNYSGKLPAKADITINVGSGFAGKALYYYLCNGDKTYTLIQNVVVDTDGFVTVEQDHCSTYVLTSSELLSKPDTDTGKDTNTDKNNGDKPANEAPATGDTTNYILYIILLVASLGAMLLAGSKIADRA